LGGSNASCSSNSTVNGACGTANNVTYAYDITSYGTDTQCSIGTSSNIAFPNQNSIVSWTCNGLNGGENSTLCAASRNPIPINGVCGPAAKTYSYFSTIYEGVQCLAGIATNTVFPTKGQTAQ